MADKSDDALSVMVEYYKSLPFDKNWKTSMQSAKQYVAYHGMVSDISLGQKASALCKELGYATGEAYKKDNNPNGDWSSRGAKTYPRKVLDTAFWFLTNKDKPKYSTCVDCGSQYVARASWAVRCYSCYKKSKAV